METLADNTLPVEAEGPSLKPTDAKPETKLSQLPLRETEASVAKSSHKLSCVESRVKVRRRRVLEPTSAVWAAKNQATCDKLQALKDRVDKAIREHKVFAIIGSFPSIRDSLTDRGWIEKTLPPRPKRKKALASKSSSTACDEDNDEYQMQPQEVASHLSLATAKKSDSVLVNRLLRLTPIDFFWSMRSDTIDWKDLPKKQIVNRFPRAYFTTKIGLCSYLQQMHWYCETGVSQILFPRCYNIGSGDELKAFKNDFYLTACISLLNWLVATFEARGEAGVCSQEGRIPVSVVEFAMSRLQGYMSTQVHEDIDKLDPEHIWQHQWDQFLTCFHMVTTSNHLLITTKDCTLIKELYSRAKSTMQNLKKYWPQLALDGTQNIWIVKPGNKSRGRGIILMNKLEDILSKVDPAIAKETRFVVQKYIEHPLLIHHTKFDIRQWFLVTSANPLTIWMYKESYLRFCSQTFNLKNMHESVHLCNNAIQVRYKNGVRESADLPDENMWDCYTFKTYLKGIGHGNIWDELIYPGMREGIIGTLLASQEHMDRRTNCFELFGADFMLTEDFSPWLIEINSCPCMAPSTSVTARMCGQCLEDVIKVVVDRRSDRNASTGMFEMVYKQHIPPAPPYLGVSLSVRGQKIGKMLSHTKKKSHKRESCEDPELAEGTPSQAKAKVKRYTGPIVVNINEDLTRHLDEAARDPTEEPEAKAERVMPKACAAHEKESTPKKKKKSIKKSTKSSKKAKKVVKHKVRGFTIEDDYEEETLSDCLSHQPINVTKCEWKSDKTEESSTKKQVVLSGSSLSSSLDSLSEINSSESSEISRSVENSSKQLLFSPESLSPKSITDSSTQQRDADTDSTKELVSTPESISPTGSKDEDLPTELCVTSNAHRERAFTGLKLQTVDVNFETCKPAESEPKKNYSESSLKVFSKNFHQSGKNHLTVQTGSPIIKTSDELLSEKLNQMKLTSHDLLSKIKQITANEYAALEPTSYTFSRAMEWDDHFTYTPTISEIVNKLAHNHQDKDSFIAEKTKSQRLMETLSNTLFPRHASRVLSRIAKDDIIRQPSFLDLKIRNELIAKQLEKSAKCPRIRIGLSPQVYNNDMEKRSASRAGLPIIRPKTHQKLTNNNRSIEDFYAVGMSLKGIRATNGIVAKESLIMTLSSLPPSLVSKPATTETTTG